MMDELEVLLAGSKKNNEDAMMGDAMMGDAMMGDAMNGDAMNGDAMNGDAMNRVSTGLFPHSLFT